MICNTCGRDNPEHLSFCQECGQRLAPRLATPTPPQGVPPLTDGAAVARDSRATPQPPQRPPAPEINFSRKPEPPPEERIACPLCGSRNQRGLRFCVTCGHLLAQGEASLKATLESNTPQRRSVAPAANASESQDPFAVAPIAPSRVVQLGEPPAVTPEARICSRCRGVSEGQFCRFCGNSLADGMLAPLHTGLQPAVQAMQPAQSLAPPRAASVPPPAPAKAAAMSWDDPVHPAPAAPTVPPAPPQTDLAAIGGVRSTVASAGAAAQRARLVLIARDGGEGPSYAVSETTDIGRSEGNIVIGDDRYVSPRHARLSLRGSSYHLRDLGSTNGVFLRIPFSPDGARDLNPEQTLGDQELFLVGQQVLRFEVVKHAEEGFGVASDNGTLLFGTPAAPRFARLAQRTVEGVVRDVFHLRKAETVIGRESGDIVFTDDPFLSRRHAVLRVHGAGGAAKGPRRYTLADLGSSNGTFLQIREEVRLRSGDHFRIGQQLFRFDLDATRAGQ